MVGVTLFVETIAFVKDQRMLFKRRDDAGAGGELLRCKRSSKPKLGTPSIPDYKAITYFETNFDL
jgi:hypothetical protein